MKVFIMIGCPGAGKSTWATKENLILVSRDIIREQLGLCGKDEKIVGTAKDEFKVTSIEYKKIAKLLEGDKDFAVDDTNLHPTFRKKLLDFIKNNNPTAEIVGVRINTSLETCIKRRDNQIPADVLKTLWGKVASVKAGEFDEFKEVKGE